MIVLEAVANSGRRRKAEEAMIDQKILEEKVMVVGVVMFPPLPPYRALVVTDTSPDVVNQMLKLKG